MTLAFTDWHGHFYKLPEDRLDYFNAPLQVRTVLGPLYDFHARLPWDSDVEEASKRYPEHAETLRQWRTIWDSNFPDWRDQWNSQPGYITERSGPISVKDEPGDDEASGQREYILEAIASGERLHGSHANNLMSMATSASRTGASALEEPVAVDPYIEVLRSAHAVLAFRYLRPQISAISAGGEKYLLIGFDEEGWPRFLSTRKLPGFSGSDVHRPFNDVYNLSFSLPTIWRIPELDQFRHGQVIGTYDHDEERDTAEGASESHNLLCAIIADMAVQGIAEVTIENTWLGLYKNAPKKWHVNVEGCTDPLAVSRRLTDAIHDPGSWMMTVAPRFKAKHRLRFFVRDGEIIGSAAADPHATPRLDDRAFNENVFDVESGKTVENTAAALNMEIRAKKIVKILAEHEVRDYALDLEVSRPTIVIGGIYPLTAVDTYSFPIAHLMRHVSGEAEKTFALIDEAAVSVSGEFGEWAPLLPQLVEAVTHEQMARLLIVNSYGRGRFGKEAFAKELKKAMQNVLWAANRIASDGLFSKTDADLLGFARPDRSVISDWLRKQDSDGHKFVLKTCLWIAEKKGISLVEAD